LSLRRHSRTCVRVALAVITSQRGVLLGRRADGDPSWVFPGGKIEPGEDAEAAAVREVLEETGLSVHTTGVIGSREHPATGVPVTYIAAVSASSWETFSPGRELTELRWVTLLEAERLTEGTMFSVVRDYLERALILGER
jgi:8-oxo-dGTP diphosphatase